MWIWVSITWHLKIWNIKLNCKWNLFAKVFSTKLPTVHIHQTVLPIKSFTIWCTFNIQGIVVYSYVRTYLDGLIFSILCLNIPLHTCMYQNWNSSHLLMTMYELYMCVYVHTWIQNFRSKKDLKEVLPMIVSLFQLLRYVHK